MNIQALQTEYRERLTQKILPFWLTHGIDRVHGGIYTGLDRDGSLLETDKSVWFQGRALWTFATAYIEIEQNPVYLEACRSLADFIDSYATDPKDGRMYFRLTAEGKPVVKRLRYFFSEAFAAIGFASLSRALSDPAEKKHYAQKAFDLFKKIDTYRHSPELFVPKFDPENAASRGFGVPMILLNTSQELRKACPEYTDYFNTYIDSLIDEIKTYFVRPDLGLVLEQCALDGSLQKDHFEGRLLNPGHAIEGAWFIMNEARYRGNDPALTALGVQMLDWMWKIGWDEQYGGIIYFRDALGKSATDYWHDMKFWWPQNEAAIANLMAFVLTQKKVYADNFTKVHEYVHSKLADDEYGEWYGYLHRDGSLSTPLKGNMYKGPFHIPRMYIVCAELFALAPQS